MNSELTFSNCDLIGLLASQPNIGFVIIGLDRKFHHATHSARDLLFGLSDFDPVAKTLEEVEGRAVAEEWTSCIERVCTRNEQLRFQQIRLGRLMTAMMWPLSKDAGLPPDAAIVMITFAADTSAPGMLEHLEVTKPSDDRPSAAATAEVMSQYASWGHLQSLTPRERDVLVLIGRGLSQKEIADKLSVSAKTVETHRMRLGKKLDIRSGAELVRIACHSGLQLAHSSLKPHADAAWMIADSSGQSDSGG